MIDSHPQLRRPALRLPVKPVLRPRRNARLFQCPPAGSVARRGGFTLLELVVSMAIMSVLMLGIGSAMLLASRAVPAQESVFRYREDASAAIQQMVAELHTANGVSKVCGNSVEFTVQDRDNNGTSETILYQWSLLPGASLMRRYNGGTSVGVAEDVWAFTVGYTTRSSGGRNLVQEISILLQLGSDSSAKVQTAVQILNQPDAALLAACPS